MGQNSRNQGGSVNRLTEATDEAHCTLAQRIMTCGEIVRSKCMGQRKVNPGVTEYVNSAIVDCVADCIDILRGEKHDAGIDNR